MVQLQKKTKHKHHESKYQQKDNTGQSRIYAIPNDEKQILKTALYGTDKVTL